MSLMKMASRVRVGSSVKARLPLNCFLNLHEDDEGTLQLITDVENSYFSKRDVRASMPDSDASSDEDNDILNRSNSKVSIEDELADFDDMGCGCTHLYAGRPCSEEVGFHNIRTTRQHAAELTKDELDMIVLGHLNHSRETTITLSKRTRTERKRSVMKYYLCGKEICKATYIFSYGLSKKRLKNLFKHYDENGFTPRTHGNKGKIPHNATTILNDEHVVSFIRTYTDINALALRGKMPKMDDFTVMMLPSEASKNSVWREYVRCCTESGLRPVGLSKFKVLWKKYLPDIAVMKNSLDMCDICQKNNNMIMKSANLDEIEKCNRLQLQEQHLRLASECRKYYKAQCESAKEYWHSLSESEKNGELDGPIHISFDYAQNLVYPYSPLQFGPMFFKSPKKCAIFGVCAEHLPKQVNYLIDEGDLTGKGANETISYLHHYLFHHINKTKSLHFHCDKGHDQNKNNYLMQYMCWRIISGQNKSIEVSFMMPYHSRFGTDWCFGLIKLKYRRSYVSSMVQIADVILSSATKNINETQMIRDPLTEDVVVNAYNWKSFFNGLFHTIPNIGKYHHFRFSNEYPGYVFLREYPSSPEIYFKMIQDGKVTPNRYSLPLNITPPGLMPERAWYLYDNVRMHCDEPFVDISFPKPQMPRPPEPDYVAEAINAEAKRAPDDSTKPETESESKKQKIAKFSMGIF